MAEVHKYFCTHCRLYIFGDTASRLASTVNSHNDRIHPTEFANWNSLGIVRSQQYSSPSEAPAYLSSYTHSKEWGDAKPPIITESDKLLLAKGGVRW